MKKIKDIQYKLRLLVIVVSVFWLFPVEAFTQDFAKEADSLLKVLSTKISQADELSVLHRLSKIHQMTPKQVYYLEKKVTLAEQIDSVEAIYAATSDLVSYYNNLNKRDSLVYWLHRLDSVANNHQELPNELFDSRSLSCMNLLWSRNYEQALTDAVKLYRLADDSEHNYGRICCSNCLGQIYMAIRRDSDAVVAFQEGLDRLKLIERNFETELALTSYQTESCLRTNMYEKVHGMLRHYKRLIDEQAERNRRLGEIFPIDHEYWLIYSFYTNLYLRENNLAKAKEALNQATHYAKTGKVVERDYAETTYLAIKARYFEKAGDLSLALYYINQLLSLERLPEDLQFKADILKRQGKTDEALVLYDEIYKHGTKRNDEMFVRQINQLRTLHDLSNKDSQDREMKINKEQMEQKKHQLIFYFLVIIALLFTLYILYRYIRHAQKLKNELLHEKDALLASEKKLLLEKLKAEDASRMKSAFIANMSHEIRSPLNAIVGFSDLLIDEDTATEDKAQFSEIIQNNTDLLLTLVNDVLDLSRMETGDLSFQLQHYILFDCCRKALDCIRQRIPAEVKLTFTPATEKIYVYTDTLRLQQLLINLLANSAKFTVEGEINLSYTLINGGKQVRISVTDTGSGIPLEKQANIFKRFEKLDDYKSGVGLGLSICSLIAEHLGGSISIDSTYTNGARFVFIHPCEISSSACNQQTGETK